MNHKIIKLPKVIEKTGKSRAGIYKDMAAGTFPRQIKTGQSSVGWLEANIDQWIEDCVAASRGDAE